MREKVIMEDLAKQIFATLDRKKWKTHIDISNDLDVISPKIINILLYGRNIGVFSYEQSYKWKLCKRTNQEKIDFFFDELNRGIEIPEKTLNRYYDLKHKRITHNIKHKKLKSKSKSKITKIDSSGNAFHNGKKKLYKGPVGQYWSDPNYEKREWE